MVFIVIVFFAATSVSMFVFFRRHICVNVLSMLFGYVLGLVACSAFSCLKLCGGVFVADSCGCMVVIAFVVLCMCESLCDNDVLSWIVVG